MKMPIIVSRSVRIFKRVLVFSSFFNGVEEESKWYNYFEIDAPYYLWVGKLRPWYSSSRYIPWIVMSSRPCRQFSIWSTKPINLGAVVLEPLALYRQTCLTFKKVKGKKERLTLGTAKVWKWICLWMIQDLFTWLSRVFPGEIRTVQ